jgi:hypothetical protein
MEESKIQIEVLESPRYKLECKVCGIEECQKCYACIKKERIKSGIFVGSSAISMIGLSFLAGPAFIGLGLTCGTLVSLIYSII